MKRTTPWGPQPFGNYMTPAANIGRAGQIKARIGELRDAQVIDEPDLEQDTQAADQSIPEIEYMPSIEEVPYYFPDALDELPRAQEIGSAMAARRFVGGTDEMYEVIPDAPSALALDVLPPTNMNPYPDRVRRCTVPGSNIRPHTTVAAHRAPTTLSRPRVRTPGAVRATAGNSNTQTSRVARGPGLAAALAHPALRDLANDALGKITAQADTHRASFVV